MITPKTYGDQQDGASRTSALLILFTPSLRHPRRFIAIAAVALFFICASLFVSTGMAAAAAGTLDATFSRTGMVVTNFTGNNDEAHGVAVQPDGKVVVVGSSFANNKALIDFAVARYNSDGSLDTRFGKKGQVVTDFFQNVDSAAAVALLPDGRIVVAGTAQTGPDKPRVFALARYNGDGSLDTSFGTGGKVTTSFGGFLAGINAVSIQKDGKIVVAGTADFNPSVPGGTLDFAAARYNSNGALDTGFGNGGKVVTDFFGSNDMVEGMLLQADGKIVLVGSAFNPSAQSSGFALARYDVSGRPDTSFGGSGQLTTNFAGSAEADGVALQADGKIVVAGTVADFTRFGNDFALARYNTDGSLDDTFGGGGQSTGALPGSTSEAATGVALQADGKIVVVGSALVDASEDFVLARYNTDGSLDSAYGNGGEITQDFFNGTDTASAVAIQANGSAIAVGRAFNGGSYDFALARYQSGDAVPTPIDPGPVTPPTPAPTPVPAPPPAAAPTLVSIVLNPSSVQGAAGTTATITLSGIAPVNGPGVGVALKSSDSQKASVVVAVIVPAGQSSVTVPVSTSSAKLGGGVNTVTISATLDNVSKSATLSITR